jgi:hypothetical protein
MQPSRHPSVFQAVLRLHSACSPGTSSPRVTVYGHRQSQDLSLTYQCTGDLSLFRFPDASHPAPPDRLWAHSCYEVFWRRDGEEAYQEYNFSPSGQWASYAFSRYRQHAEISPGLPAPSTLRWAWAEARSTLGLQVVLPLPRHEGRLRLALAVVLERTDGNCLYYALHHAPGQADFHHPDNFVLLPE